MFGNLNKSQISKCLCYKKPLHFLKLFEISENVLFIENWFTKSKNVLGFKFCSEFRKISPFHNLYRNSEKKNHIFIICLEFESHKFKTKKILFAIFFPQTKKCMGVFEPRASVIDTLIRVLLQYLRASTSLAMGQPSRSIACASVISQRISPFASMDGSEYLAAVVIRSPFHQGAAGCLLQSLVDRRRRPPPHSCCSSDLFFF